MVRFRRSNQNDDKKKHLKFRRWDRDKTKPFLPLPVSIIIAAVILIVIIAFRSC